MLLKPAVLKGSLATGLGVGAGPGVPGDPAFSVNNSFCLFAKHLQHRRSDCFSSIVPSTTLLRNKRRGEGHEERIEPSMEEVLAVPLPASPPTEPGN